MGRLAAASLLVLATGCPKPPPPPEPATAPSPEAPAQEPDAPAEPARSPVEVISPTVLVVEGRPVYLMGVSVIPAVEDEALGYVLKYVRDPVEAKILPDARQQDGRPAAWVYEAEKGFINPLNTLNGAMVALGYAFALHEDFYGAEKTAKQAGFGYWGTPEGKAEVEAERPAPPAPTPALSELDQQRGELLLLMAAAGRDDEVRKLLNAGVPVDYSPSGITPLHKAATAGRVKTCLILVNAGADLQRKTPMGWHTPADLADVNGHKALAGLLRNDVVYVDQAGQLYHHRDCPKAAKGIAGTTIDAIQLGVMPAADCFD